MLGSLAVSKSQEPLDYNKTKDISERDQEFRRTHITDWGHGRSEFYTLITYMPNLGQATVLASKQQTRELHFEPRLSFSHMESYMRALTEAYYSGALAKEFKNLEPEEAVSFRSDMHALPFSGLLNIPAFTFCTGGAVVPKRKPALFCYQTHFEVGEITYMFGGLRCDPLTNFKALGIPKNTELSQISVHFTQELPPYVNKDVFMSPLMGYNYSFITFNPTRGTVHEYPLAYMLELTPSTICDMQGTQISETQVFFCGGFHMHIDSVTFKPELNRWIIEKSITMNNKGYILDTLKLTFTKIDIVAKLEMVFRGRVGATLTSSYFACDHTHDDASSLNFSKEEHPTTKNLSAAEQTILNESFSGNQKTSAPTSDVPSPLTKTNTKTQDSSISRTPSTSGAKAPVKPALITSPSALAKKSSLLSKSTRLFHRNLTKQSPSSTHSSVYSLYSNQVKQHRSQSLPSNSESRPSSPQLLQKMGATKLHVDTGVDFRDQDSRSTIASPTTLSTPLVDLATLEHGPGVSSPAVSVTSEADSQFNGHESTKAEVFSICVYMFGGFHLAQDYKDQPSKFVASNKLLKIELLIEDFEQSKFHTSALMIGVTPQGDVVPLPRGYFAYFLTDNEGPFESCELYTQGIVDSDTESLKLQESACDATSSGQKSHSKCMNGDVQLDSKRLIIHGGVDENKEVFSDFYSYSFSTETWQKLPTYAFDYYNKPKRPTEDEDLESLVYESQVADAVPREAELRCCHHRASTYTEDGKEQVVFSGGYTNDYLRHFDSKPYESDRLDVSRLARLQLGISNSNLLRLPILNLSTQTWKFSRYFYDLREVATSEAGKLLTQRSYMKNSRVTLIGGAFLRVGKQLTFCHGIAVFVPEMAEDFRKMQEEHASCVILLGGHFHLTFPGM